jgi:hypothetical protein
MDRTVKFLLGLIALSLLQSGCARPTVGWARSGASYPQYLEQRMECAQQAMTSEGGVYSDQYGVSGRSRSCMNQGVFFSCMYGKGWTRNDARGFTPPPGGSIQLCRR